MAGDQKYLFYSLRGVDGTRLTIKSSDPAKVAAEAVDVLAGAMPGIVSERVHFLPNAAALAASGYAPDGYFTAEETAAMATAEGFHDPRTGRTIVFTDNVTVRPGESPRSAVARVILHERVGHDGVNHLIATSPEFAVRWDALAAQIPQADLDALARDYPHLTGDRAQLALEWLAQQADAIETNRLGGTLNGLSGLARQMMEAIKAFLAKAFKNFSRSAHSANEVRELVTRAREAALSGTAIPTSPEGLQFSLGGNVLRHRQGDPYRVNALGWRTLLTGSPLPRAMVGTGQATDRGARAAGQATRLRRLLD